ncbi:acylneuraminate cytidylyltransferase [Kribbella turkmenica]|uniref:Acylneuraminate cytidylyltransferase n=1 Tax=Kribbella turkmenica TaxID=2530375 RepID=A0A4R4X9N7_9ACTN|nr:glycosyltransferase family protein [Kribbella turkmenica]TDD27233.1 acylneuraminate cytidylyltransferase [Kribbella turkmenica]
MTIGIITQARATSTRLPAKVLLTAGGKSYLHHHLERLTRTGLPVIVATTTNPDDEPIVELSTELGFPVYRGSELDVLSRFAGAIREHELTGVVRVTSDCPLIDPAVVTEGVERYRAENAGNVYVSNCLTRTYPRGMDYEVFSAARLLQADEVATLPVDREHVTTYLHQNRAGDMRLVNVPWDGGDGSTYRLTLDTEDDRKLLGTLIEEFSAERLDCAELVALMDAHPELAALNAHVEQKKLNE